MLFIKKVGNKYNYNDCIYIDNKYWKEAGFTTPQKQITNIVKNGGKAEITIVSKNMKMVNGDALPEGEVLKIHKVETYTTNEQLELINNKNPF